MSRGEHIHSVTTMNTTVVTMLCFEKSQVNFRSIVSGNSFLSKMQNQVDSKDKKRDKTQKPVTLKKSRQLPKKTSVQA